VIVLSGSTETSSDWVYRIFDHRTISMKAKNDQVRKIAVVDIQTNTPFGIDVPTDVPFEDLQIGKQYFASLKVYTAKDTSDISADFVEFFKVLDVDHSMEEFVKAYWLYPKFIKFELVEAEPL
jgi:hypothetical protein